MVIELFIIALIITILGILYIISPIDLIPDFIPGLGWIDDIIVAIIIALTWLFVLGVIIVKTLIPVFIILAIAIILIFVLKMLSKIFFKRRRR